MSSSEFGREPHHNGMRVLLDACYACDLCSAVGSSWHCATCDFDACSNCEALPCQRHIDVKKKVVHLEKGGNLLSRKGCEEALCHFQACSALLEHLALASLFLRIGRPDDAAKERKKALDVCKLRHGQAHRKCHRLRHHMATLELHENDMHLPIGNRLFCQEQNYDGR